MIVLRTGLFGKANALEQAAAALDGAAVARRELPPAHDAAAWDRLVAELLAADRIVVL